MFWGSPGVGRNTPHPEAIAQMTLLWLFYTRETRLTAVIFKGCYLRPLGTQKGPWAEFCGKIAVAILMAIAMAMGSSNRNSNNYGDPASVAMAIAIAIAIAIAMA